MTSQSWGTKRNCPNCSAHFYDLNKTPATCPKCKHQFEPAAPVRAKRKPARRSDVEPDMTGKHITVLPPVKKGESKKEKKPVDTEGAGEDIVEMEDDAEGIQDLSELEEREAEPVAGDDADDETIIEELPAGEKTLVGNVEEEEASTLADEIEEEKGAQKKKAKKKP